MQFNEADLAHLDSSVFGRIQEMHGKHTDFASEMTNTHSRCDDIGNTIAICNFR